LHLYCFVSFFFYCPCLHRALHSFPTRRSSDLSLCALAPGREHFCRDGIEKDMDAYSHTTVWPSARSAMKSIILPSALVLMNLTEDRKSTRLNSSHSQISYAVFCLKKKKKIQE